LSDVESGTNQSAVDQASETPGTEARRFREVLEGQASRQSVDIVRDIVREAPLLALASAFLMGILVGRRR
jgi:hypothetical protein